MNIIIVTCAHARKQLTRIALNHYTDMGMEIICCQTKGKDTEFSVNPMVKVITANNEPLSQKFNTVFAEARKYNPDAVILTGSADLISSKVFDYYQKNYSADADYMAGFGDIYLMEIATGKVIHWKGLIGQHADFPVGVGRIFSKKILNRLNWRPYGDMKLNRGLDVNSSLLLKSKKIEQRKVSMSEAGEILALKASTSINKFDDWRYNAADIAIEFPEFAESVKSARLLEVNPDDFKAGTYKNCRLLVDKFMGETLGKTGDEILLESTVALGMLRNKLIELI